jgi:hypothetical protein
MAVLEPGELSLSLYCLLLGALLPGTLGLDMRSGVDCGQGAEFVDLGSEQCGARPQVLGGAAWVDPVHPVLMGARVLGPVLASQQRQALAPVALAHCSTPGVCGLDSLGGIAHTGVALGPSSRDPSSPSG